MSNKEILSALEATQYLVENSPHNEKLTAYSAVVRSLIAALKAGEESI